MAESDSSAQVTPPSVGRIVHVVQAQHFTFDRQVGSGVVPLPRDERHAAAIITEVLSDYRIWVQVFPPPVWQHLPWPDDGIPFDPDGAPGTWHWPERA